jgi:CBS domain-containing protein
MPRFAEVYRCCSVAPVSEQSTTSTALRAAGASPLDGVGVLDAMRPGVVTCLPEDRLATLAAIMVTHGIHAVVLGPVEERTPLIVSDLDLLRAALERADARASDIAREPAATVDAEAPLREAVAMMSERGVAHLLVTGPGSAAPAGVVSSFDVASVLGGQQPRVARMLRPGPARPSPSARTLSQARVQDVMHRGVTTCLADATLPTVARTMAEHRVHCVAVAGITRPGNNLTWGLIGDMDLLLALHRGALQEPAAAIAATSPIAVEEQDSLERAGALMVEHDATHAVVTSPAGMPAGMLSTLDLASILGAGA